MDPDVDEERIAKRRRAEARPPEKKPSFALPIIAVLFLVALVAGRFYVTRNDAPPPPPSSVPPAPTISATAVTALQVPSSGDPHAIEAYASGVRAYRAGIFDRAAAELERAESLDKTFALAALRRAMLPDARLEARTAALQRATMQQAALGDRDRAVLDAIAPCIANTASADACALNLHRAMERFPGDAELPFLACEITLLGGKPGSAIADCDRSLALDHDFIPALIVRARAFDEAGGSAEALASARQCFDKSPESKACADILIRLHRERGECDAASRVSKEIDAGTVWNRQGGCALH